MKHATRLISMILLLALIASAASFSPALADPGPAWAYQRPVLLSIATPEDNYQIRVQIANHTNMNADGSDLRFYDASDVEADYWIESWNPAGTSVVWVEVPSTGTTSLTMYFSNPLAAAASSGDDTFIFFDDFSGSAVNTSKWDVFDPDASITVSGGSATLLAGDQLIATTSFEMSDGVLAESILSSSVSFEAGSRASLNGASSLSGASTFFTADQPVNSRFAVWSHGRDNVYGIHTIHEGDGVDDGDSTSQYNQIYNPGAPGTWNSTGFVLGTAFETGRLEYFLNYAFQGDSITNVPAVTMYPLLNVNANNQFSLTTFRVRNFVSGYAPAVIVGSSCFGAITVMNANDSGGGSLRQALADVCEGGTITFDGGLSGQTINLSATLLIDADVTIDGSALSPVLTISGDTAPADGVGNVRVFYIGPGVTASLDSLAIADGYTSGDGGAIRNDGTLTVANSAFSDNRAGAWGGAIYGLGPVMVSSSTFSNNSAYAGGSIGANGAALSVTGSAFTGNSTTGGWGGAVYSNAGVAVAYSVFNGNASSNGGGIAITTGSLSVHESSFSGNSAAIGGAIHNGSGTASVTNSTFSGNTVTNLGGAINSNRTFTIVNSTFSANMANFGGAVFNTGASANMTMINATFSGNTAANNGSGIYNGAALNYTNTLIANSTGPTSCYNSGTISTNISNLVEGVTTCGAPAYTSGANLDGLADNGGSTETFALLPGSQAINTGSDAACTAAPVSGLDQRGMTRPQGVHCDIGAFETTLQSSPIFVVNSNADTDDGLCSYLTTGDCTLREALNTALALPGTDTITFDPALSGDTIHLGATLLIASNVVIDGSALASPITISGDTDDNDVGDVSVFQVGIAVTASLDSLMITKGYTAGNGGAVRNDSIVTVTNCAFSDNRADGEGGAIYGTGTTTVVDSTFDNNNAYTGGGIRMIGAALSVTGSEFTGNSTTGGWGGAISSNAGVEVANSAFTSNTSATGGGIALTTGSLTVTGSTFSGNSAPAGGAIRNNSGTATVTNSTFSGNTVINNGGAINNSSVLTIANSSFGGNTANFGGAIASTGISASLSLTNATFSGNTASNNGSAIFNTAALGYTNTLIANSTGPTSCYSSGTISTNISNLVEGATSCGTPAYTSGANLDGLADNGGSTETFALLPGSRAINTGSDTACTAAPVSGLDQRGVTRPQGLHCDIGAFELVFSAVLPGVDGGNGPGGVGVADGQGALVLWLRSDAGVYADAACTTAPANGGDVTCWRDQSGYLRNYTQAAGGSRPNYYTAGQNNQPVIRFNGTSDYLANAGSTGAVLAAGDDTFTYFASWISSAFQSQVIFEQNNLTLVNGMRAALLAIPSAQYGFNGESNDFHNAAPYASGQYEVSSLVLNGAAANNVLVYDSGTQYTGTIDNALQSVGTTGGSAVGYKISTASEFLNGEAPEVVVFSDALNDVQRILVQNYLSAKFNVALSTDDRYDGDTLANGNFDLAVAGIGRLGGISHAQAHAGGMIVINRSFLQDNGDWLLFGHRSVVNSNTIADLPGDGDWLSAASPVRWERHFYIDVTDNPTLANCAVPGTCFVDMIFDYSEGGMDGNPASLPNGPVSNYRLLKRAGETGQFSDIATASAIVGDQVHFLNVDVSLLGSNFTLGTLDSQNSPTAIQLANFDWRKASSTPAWLALVGLLIGACSMGLAKRRK